MDIPKNNDLPETDPRHHALNLSGAIKGLADHARQDTKKVDQKSGRVLFEMTAEVLLGLAKGLEDFGKGSEQAMK